MTSKTLYLHVGSHGSVIRPIQDFLYRNREVLAGAGVLYPEVGLGGSAHHRLARGAGMPLQEGDETFLAEALATIVEQAAAPGVRAAVISSEGFAWTPGIHLLAPLRDHFDVRIVMYLSRQDHLLESIYRQHLVDYDKRFDGSIYQLALKYNFYNQFNFRLLAERWESVFGRDKILVRPCGTGHVARDLCEDFLSVIGVDSGSIADRVVAAGPDGGSLPTSALPYVARINRQPLSREQHGNVLRVLSEIVPPVAGARLLSHWESGEFYGRFQQGNRIIADRYLGLAEDPFAVLTQEPEQEVHIRPGVIEASLLQRAVSAATEQEPPTEAAPPPRRYRWWPRIKTRR